MCLSSKMKRARGEQDPTQAVGETTMLRSIHEASQARRKRDSVELIEIESSVKTLEGDIKALKDRVRDSCAILIESYLLLENHMF